MEKWDTHGEKWDVMSQFSPYMPLRIVPDVYLLHLLKNQNSKQHLAYRYPRRRFYTRNFSFVTVLTKLSAIWFLRECGEGN